MDYCKPVKEVDDLKYEWIPKKIVKIFGDLTLEQLLLIVRNGEISYFFHNDDYTEGEKMELTELADDFTDIVAAEGFIRPEILYSATPELYFVNEYLIEKELINSENVDVFMPYCLSHEEYESYSFNFTRREAIVNLLSNFFDEDVLREFKKEFYTMTDEGRNKELLQKAKDIVYEERDKILPLLEQVFMMY